MDCPTNTPTPEPCNGNGVATEPLDPSTNIGEGGCAGIPTVIEMSNPNETPCAKIKVQRADKEFSDRITDLEGKTGLTKETGYSQKTNGNYTYHDNGGTTSNSNTLTPPDLSDPSNYDVLGVMHTHLKDFTYSNPNGPGTIDKLGINIFSPADIAYFMNMVKIALDNGRPLADVFMVMVSKKGNYQIRFTGNQYQVKTFDAAKTKTHNEPFEELMKPYLDNPKKMEFAFLKYISDAMNLKGITLYRMNEDGGNTEIKLNTTKSDTDENNCLNKI